MREFLNSSRVKHFELIERSCDMLYLVDAEGNFKYVNESSSLLTGYSPEQLMEMNLLKIISASDRHAFGKALSSLTPGNSISYESRFITSSGQSVLVHQRLTAHDDEGKVLIAGIACDFTPFANERELRENWIVRLSVLIENLQEGVLVEDENRQIVLVNRAFCDLFSVRLIPEDLIGKNYVNAQNHIKRLFADPSEFLALEENLVRNRHIVIGQNLRMRNGQIYERDYVPIYIETGYAGNLWKYRDSTEKIRTRNELEKAKRKYQNVIDTMRLGLLEVDHDDRIIHANEAFCEILGYKSPEDLIGKKSFETLLDEEQQQVMLQQMANREKGDSNTYEIKVKRADGGHAWMLISGAALMDENDQVIGSVGVHLDISYQKRVSMELEEKKALKNMMEWQEKALLQLEEKVIERTSEVLKQKEIIEEKNIQITKSIEYAFRIQQAILPPLSVLRRSLEDSFIIYQPMHIVGGDFYFFKQNDDGSCYICAADSTGHGIPGGFMSMLGFENLKEAVANGGEPGDMIRRMNGNIKDTLSTNDSEIAVADGFDLALCRIDPVTRTVDYAGAFRPLWIARVDAPEIEEVRGTRASIGGRTPKDHVFETHHLKLKKGDCIYLFTDGCTDQFGEAGKRITSRRVRELLSAIKGMSMPQQGKHMERFLKTWQGTAPQTDDVMMIGIKL